MDGRLYQAYLMARNQASKAIRQAKKIYESKITKESKNNKKAEWK